MGRQLNPSKCVVGERGTRFMKKKPKLRGMEFLKREIEISYGGNMKEVYDYFYHYRIKKKLIRRTTYFKSSHTFIIWMCEERNDRTGNLWYWLNKPY